MYDGRGTNTLGTGGPRAFDGRIGDGIRIEDGGVGGSPPPTPPDSIRNRVCSCLVHLCNADAAVVQIEGKLFGYGPTNDSAPGVSPDERSIEQLLTELRARLAGHATRAESVMGRL